MEAKSEVSGEDRAKLQRLLEAILLHLSLSSPGEIRRLRLAPCGRIVVWIVLRAKPRLSRRDADRLVEAVQQSCVGGDWAGATEFLRAGEWLEFEEMGFYGDAIQALAVSPQQLPSDAVRAHYFKAAVTGWKRWFSPEMILHLPAWIEALSRNALGPLRWLWNPPMNSDFRAALADLAVGAGEHIGQNADWAALAVTSRRLTPAVLTSLVHAALVEPSLDGEVMRILGCQIEEAIHAGQDLTDTANIVAEIPFAVRSLGRIPSLALLLTRLAHVGFIDDLRAAADHWGERVRGPGMDEFKAELKACGCRLTPLRSLHSEVEDWP